MKSFITKCLMKIHSHCPTITVGFCELIASIFKRLIQYRSVSSALWRKGLVVSQATDLGRAEKQDDSQDIVALYERAAKSMIEPEAYDIAHEVFYKQGFHLLRKHYYLPIPDEADFDEKFFEQSSDLVGLDMNTQYVLSLLDTVFPIYNKEFRKLFPIHSSGVPEKFYLINGSYMAVDAHVYYALIRHFKPKHIVEIGAGRSTQIAIAAMGRNKMEKGHKGSAITVIEPFPSDFLRNTTESNLSTLIEDKVQNVGLELFKSLKSGDILFIDSTHALREGGDVQYEYLEILPRLAPGVLVHIHDISLPKHYPRVYFENRLYWNEQYLLQAFLAFNFRFEVVWPGNHMILKYPERVLQVFPEFHIMRESYPMSEPTAFWIRVCDQGSKERL